LVRLVQRINAEVTWEAGFDPASQTWVAKSDALALTASGETWADLMSIIAESQSLLFADLLADGELPQFLLDRGWRPSTPLPVGVPVEDIVFDVPTVVKPAIRAPY
jgi:hypothetical protein